MNVKMITLPCDIKDIVFIRKKGEFVKYVITNISLSISEPGFYDSTSIKLNLYEDGKILGTYIMMSFGEFRDKYERRDILSIEEYYNSWETKMKIWDKVNGKR